MPDIGPRGYRRSKKSNDGLAFVKALQAADSNPVIPVALQVGQVTDTIEVQATTAQVKTRSMGVANVSTISA